MTWETIIGGALTSFSNFVQTLISIIGVSINAEAAEGILALIGIGAAIRIINGAPKIPGKIAERIKKRKDDDDEWEYIRVRRRRE